MATIPRVLKVGIKRFKQLYILPEATIQKIKLPFGAFICTKTSIEKAGSCPQRVMLIVLDIDLHNHHHTPSPIAQSLELQT